MAFVVKRLDSDLQEHAFLMAGYAIWRAATKVRILSASRNALKSILRAKAAFLDRSAFE
jgi:hypothetical protein